MVKYKLDHIRRKLETEERDATNRASFKCGQCDKQYTDLEVITTHTTHPLLLIFFE